MKMVFSAVTWHLRKQWLLLVLFTSFSISILITHWISGARNVSTLSATAVVACLSGRIVTVLHRPESDDSSADDLDNQFWTNYRRIDKILLNSVLRFPEFAATSRGATTSHITFLNLSIQSCTISLHQAALFTAGKNPRLAEIRSEAKSRCLAAAQSIVKRVREVDQEVLLKVRYFPCLSIRCLTWNHFFRWARILHSVFIWPREFFYSYSEKVLRWMLSNPGEH